MEPHTARPAWLRGADGFGWLADLAVRARIDGTYDTPGTQQLHCEPVVLIVRQRHPIDRLLVGRLQIPVREDADTPIALAPIREHST